MNRAPFITQMSIADGPQGTLETLRIMASVTRRAVNDSDFRAYIGQNFRTADDIERTFRPLYRYTDEPVETLYAAEWNLQHLLNNGYLIGDCDDISMFYGAAFRVLGLPVRFVAMRTKKMDPNFHHVVVEAFENGQWRRFDATVHPSVNHIIYGTMVENV